MKHLSGGLSRLVRAFNVACADRFGPPALLGKSARSRRGRGRFFHDDGARIAPAAERRAVGARLVRRLLDRSHAVAPLSFCLIPVSEFLALLVAAWARSIGAASAIHMVGSPASLRFVMRLGDARGRCTRRQSPLARMTRIVNGQSHRPQALAGSDSSFQIRYYVRVLDVELGRACQSSLATRSRLAFGPHSLGVLYRRQGLLLFPGSVARARAREVLVLIDARASCTGLKGTPCGLVYSLRHGASAYLIAI